MYNSEKYSKKRIFLTYVGILAIGLPVFMGLEYLSHPEQQGDIFNQILPILFLVVGAGSSLLVEDKSNILKTIIFFVELGIVLIVLRIFDSNNVIQVVALFSGAFWGAGRIFNRNFFTRK